MVALTKIRNLDLAAAPQAGGRQHLSAASGLAGIGDKLYVIADDELALGVFEASARPGQLIRLLPGTLPHDPVERKKVKPDFESLVRLPPFPGFEYGALFALGSGSEAARHRGVLLRLDADGEASDAKIFDLSEMLSPLRRECPRLNIEGALVWDSELRLFQRANRTDRLNAMFRCELSPVLGALANGGAIGALNVLATVPLELGEIAGVPLSITDAAMLGGGNIVFCAAAEDTEDSYNDGVCIGSAIGIAGPDGSVRYLEPAGAQKLEGIAVRAEHGAIDLLLVSDADDPELPAALYSARVALA